MTQGIEPLAASVPEAAWFQWIGRYFASLGKLYYMTERPERAAEAYRKSEALLRDWPPMSGEFSPWVWLQVLNPMLDAKEGDVIQRHVVDLKAHHSQYPLLPLVEGLVQLRCGDARQARDLLNMELAKTVNEPARCRLLYVLALAHSKLGEASEARRCRDEAERLARDLEIRDSNLELLRTEVRKMVGGQS